MLTSSEVAALRSVANQALPDTCQIQRFERTPDGMGGYEETWNTVSTQPCRISENRTQNREIEVGGQIQSSGSHIVRVPHGVDVSETDRLIVSSSGRTRTLTINRVYESSYGTLTNIGCSDTRNGGT